MKLRTRRVLQAILCPLTFTLALAVGFVISKQPPSYQASARLWIQPSASVSSGIEQDVYLPLGYFFNSPLVTAGEILRSSVVVEKACQVLQDQQRGFDVRVDKLQKGIKVDTIKNADVVIVRYEDSNPKVAAKILQAILLAFLDVNSSASSASATRMRLISERHLEAAQEKYNEVKERIRQFQAENNLVGLPSEVSGELARNESLISSIQEAQAKVAAKTQQLKLLNEHRERIKDGGSVDRPSATVFQDPVVANLRQKFAEEEVRLADLRSKLNPGHPSLAFVERKLSSTKQALSDRINVLSRPSTNPQDPVFTMAQGPNEVLSRLESQIIAEESELTGLRHLVHMLESQLPENIASVKRLPAKHMRLAELQREEQLAAELLAASERRVQASHMTESTSMSANNIQVIDPATASPVPIWPPEPAVTYCASSILGLFLAAGLWFGLGAMTPTVGKLMEAATLTGLKPHCGLRLTRGKAPKPAELFTLHGLSRTLLDIKDNGCQRVIIASPDRNDGRTAICCELALSLVQAGKRVVIVDFDFLKPSLHTQFGVPVTPGFTDLLSRDPDDNLAQITHRLSEGLTLVCAGQPAVAPDYAATENSKRLLERLEAEADFCLIDTPPLSRAPTCLLLAEPRIVLVMVVRIGQTTRRWMKAFVAHLADRTGVSRELVANDVSPEAFAELIADHETDFLD